MSARTLGNIGLSGFWALGENGWKDLNDLNLVKLSNLVQAGALSLVTSLPGSPTNGDVYVLTDAAGSHPTEIAIRDNGAWVYVVPLEGWSVWIKDEDAFYVFTGTAWTSLASAIGKQGTDIASAGTVTLGNGSYFHVAGTTTITDIDFSPDKAGRVVWLEFAGALTLTNGASLILPTGADIVTAAGDTACFVSEGSDVARCVAYTRASGAPLTGGGGGGSTINQGVHTIPVLAGAMLPRTTNGPSIGSTESATNKVMTKSWDFDQTTAEYVQIVLPMPKSWDEGTLSIQYIWRATATGDVRFVAQAVAISDDDAWDAAFGSAVNVVDSVTATGDVMVSAYSSAMTVAGTPAAEDLVVIQINRDPSHASDTIAADVQLLGVRIKFTVSAGDDT